MCQGLADPSPICRHPRRALATHAAVAALLLARGAAVDSADAQGATALHLAAASRADDLSAVLAATRSAADAKDRECAAALDAARAVAVVKDRELAASREEARAARSGSDAKS